MSIWTRPTSGGRRAWLPFAAVTLVWGMVATHQIDLPGIFADAVNPDYLVTRILNPHAERTIVWILFGNSLLGDRAPVLISLYHGSQQFWLGLPFYAVFGTTVVGVRLTHAMFALGVLAALYALLTKGMRPWFAGAICVALALDPSFSFAFRTQGYITVAPAAWLLLGLLCLIRATESDVQNPTRWLFASGAFCGLAAVGYFVWAFVLPPIAFAASLWMRGIKLARPPLVVWVLGLATGGVFYPIGYLLIARKLGSITAMFDFINEQQMRLGAFKSVLPLEARVEYAWQFLEGAVSSAWHSAVMLSGELVPTPGAGLKIGLLVGLPYLLWVYAELRRRATPTQRLLVALPLSFFVLSLIFGDRLGGHHFLTLVPLLYAALGVGLSTVIRPGEDRLMPIAAVAPLVMLAVLNINGQLTLAEKLAETRGKGFLSDVSHRFAADLNAMSEKPFLWFAEPSLALPIIMLTRATVPMTDQLDDPEPRRRLCAGRNVAMVWIDGHFTAPRAREWQTNLAWDEPERITYAQADGTVVFEVLTFRGRRHGPGCSATGNSHG